MYYNKILGSWVLDAIDYFLISALISGIAGSHLKTYFSEKEAMRRLKNSIIKKSRLLKADASESTNFDSTESIKKRPANIKKIVKFALSNRGGQDGNGYKLAEQIRNMILKLAVFLKQREMEGLLKILFTHGRLVLELILSMCQIHLTYITSNEVNPQIIVIAMTSGGSIGFTLSWVSAGTILVSPPVIASILLLRSFTQQIIHNIQFLQLKNRFNELLKDEEIREEIQTLLIDTQKKINNSNKIKFESFESLNWNKNPEIKEAAERLGIFENAPHLTGELNLNPEDPDSIKILQELNIPTKPTKPIKEIVKGEVQKKNTGKTVYFRDFVKQISDDSDMSDSGIIDAEFIKEPIRIRRIED